MARPKQSSPRGNVQYCACEGKPTLSVNRLDKESAFPKKLYFDTLKNSIHFFFPFRLKYSLHQYSGTMSALHQKSSIRSALLISLPSTILQFALQNIFKFSDDNEQRHFN